MDPEQTPPLRMAQPESPEQIAKRLQREQTTASREREFELEQSLAPFRVGSVQRRRSEIIFPLGVSTA